jgi:hypothetical protein
VVKPSLIPPRPPTVLQLSKVRWMHLAQSLSCSTMLVFCEIRGQESHPDCSHVLLRGHFRFKNMSDKEWDQIMDVHLKGAFSCTKAAWPHFRKQKFGRVINTSSAAGLYGEDDSMILYPSHLNTPFQATLAKQTTVRLRWGLWPSRRRSLPRELNTTSNQLPLFPYAPDPQISSFSNQGLIDGGICHDGDHDASRDACQTQRTSAIPEISLVLQIKQLLARICCSLCCCSLPS